jgi:methionyl-tRNA formyltransferase
MRVVFLGSGAIGVPSLKALAAGGPHEVQAVFTQPDRPAGREMKLRAPPIKVAARDLGLPVHQPAKIRAPEALAILGELQPDIIVVAAYGQLLRKSLLSLPRLGCINIHASLLPRHRGAAPVQAAILEGDSETGITIMQVDEGLDTGDILVQVATAIGAEETAGNLHDRLALLAPAALLETLDLLHRGIADPRHQDPALATYAPKIRHQDGEIDWNKPAVEIERRIRAMTPWPGAYTSTLLRNARTTLKVHRARAREEIEGSPGTIVAVSDHGILVATERGGILLQDVQIPGGKRLPAGDFLRGHPIAPGLRLGRAE